MILNEEKYAKYLLLGKNREIKSAIKKIGYITRYNLHVLGKDDVENYNSTVLWMQKHQDNFEESSYSNAISKAIKSAKRREFYKTDGISITKKELETIKSVENIREEKILFVLLWATKQKNMARQLYSFHQEMSSNNLPHLHSIHFPHRGQNRYFSVHRF